MAVERTPRRHALRWATGHAPLIATNDYRLLNVSQEWTHSLYATACGRYDALLERIESWQPTTNVAILGCLCDPDVRQQITVQHVIARPASGSLHAWVPETAWKG